MRSIGFASIGDTADPSAPQNAYYMYESLRVAFPQDRVVAIPLSLPFATRARSGFRKIVHRASGRGDSPVFASPAALRLYSAAIERAIDAHHLDIVISNQLLPLSYLSEDAGGRAIAHVDATFEGLNSLGGYLDNWSSRALDSIIHHERRAAHRADAIFCASEWAAMTLVADYEVPIGRVHMSRMGANVDGSWCVDRPATPASAPWKLLFFGSSWERKGGPMALEITRILASRGLSVELLILGPRSNVLGEADGGVARYIGQLNKSVPSECQAVREQLTDAALLMLPTMSDCSPAAVPELAALGVPAFVRDVGGVASTVTDGITGSVFPAEASPSLWADRIAALLHDKVGLDRMRKAALDDFKGQRNWAAIMGEVAR